MSAVTFHTEHGGAAILAGAERSFWGVLCSDVAAAFVPSHYNFPTEILNPSGPIPELPSGAPWRIREDARLQLSIGSRAPVFQHPTVGPLDDFPLLLNTVLAAGSDPLALIARLNGQCEIHAYVEGPDRSWMAGLIEQGRAAGLMRDSVGWDSVHTLLLSSDAEPVVTSYSVTDGFPNSFVSTWEPAYKDFDDEDDARDQWYELPVSEQWRLAMAGIRRSGRGLQLSPSSLRDPFGHRYSLLDLRPDRLGLLTAR
jgi:hypothetical protein